MNEGRGILLVVIYEMAMNHLLLSVMFVRMLVTKGGRVDGLTTGGWSPLMVAAAFNRLETASYLLSAGADRRKTNKN